MLNLRKKNKNMLLLVGMFNTLVIDPCEKSFCKYQKCAEKCKENTVLSSSRL